MASIHAVLEVSRAADLICSHLSQRDLSYATLVCRAWSRCFVPRLWKVLSISWSSRLEALRQDPALLQALARHGHHVRSLRFKSLTDQDVINLAVPWLCNLTRLDLNLGEFSLFRPDSTSQSCTHCRHRHQQLPQILPQPHTPLLSQPQRRLAQKYSEPRRKVDPRHDFMFWPLQLTQPWTCRCTWPTASVATTTTTWDLDRLVTELYEQSFSRSMPTSPVAVRPGHGHDLFSPLSDNHLVSKSAMTLGKKKGSEPFSTLSREKTTHPDRSRLTFPAPLGPLQRLLECNRELTEIHFHELLLHSVDAVALIVNALSTLSMPTKMHKISIHSSTKSSEHGVIPFASIKAIVLALPSDLKELELEFTEEIGQDEDIEARSKAGLSSNHNLTEDRDGWIMVHSMTGFHTSQALPTLQKLVYMDRMRTTPYDDCMPIHRASRDRTHFLKFLVTQCPQLLDLTLNIVDENPNTSNRSSLGASLSESCPLLQTLTLKDLHTSFSDDTIAQFISSLSSSSSSSSSTPSSPLSVSLPSSPCSVHSFASSWTTATVGTVTSIPISSSEDDISPSPPQVRTFTISSAHYVGPRTTSAIVNHLGDSLETLRLDGCDRIRSSDLWRILRMCPRLRVLETPIYNSLGKSVEPCVLNVADLVEEMGWIEPLTLNSPPHLPGAVNSNDPMDPSESTFCGKEAAHDTSNPLQPAVVIPEMTFSMGWACSQTLTRLELCLEWLEPRDLSGNATATAVSNATATSLVRISGIEYLRYMSPNQPYTKDEGISLTHPTTSRRRSPLSMPSSSSSPSTPRLSLPHIHTGHGASNPLMEKDDHCPPAASIWRAIYCQLGQLVQLEELILSDEPGFGACSSREVILLKSRQRARYWRPRESITSRPLQLPNHIVKSTLEMTLSQGLGQMKGLKQIRVLDISRLSHRMGRCEVEWARTQWPKITVLKGRLVDGGDLFQNATWTWDPMTDGK